MAGLRENGGWRMEDGLKQRSRSRVVLSAEEQQLILQFLGREAIQQILHPTQPGTNGRMANEDDDTPVLPSALHPCCMYPDLRQGEGERGRQGDLWYDRGLTSRRSPCLLVPLSQTASRTSASSSKYSRATRELSSVTIAPVHCERPPHPRRLSRLSSAAWQSPARTGSLR